MEEQLKTEFNKVIENSELSEKEIELKRKNLDNFVKEGFPSRKNESWKFSDINQIIQKNIGDLNYYNDDTYSRDFDQSVYITKLKHNKIIFINGRLENFDFGFEENDKIELSNGNLKDNNFKKDNSLINLNNVFSNKFFKIVIKENYSLKKPLVIYNITNGNIKSQNINLNLRFILEKNSCCKIIDILDDKSEKNFMNVFYNFDLSKDAILKNYKIDYKDNKNVKYFFNNINQEENSISETFILSSGPTFSKNEINCNLKGKYSSAFLNGIFSLSAEKHHEIKSSINHLVENTKSYQLVKGVLGDKSKAVYQGKIFVNSEAQKTDGYQLSKAILLNETSEFNAKPELEIYADDVKCSHGSASGNLNENSIFYLMTRGLNYKEAKNLLINSFFLEVIEKITDEEIKNIFKFTIGLTR